MKIWRDCNPPAQYGKGTHIELDGNELACAIHAYLCALDINIDGPSTVLVITEEGDSGLCGGARVYVDPSGRVIHAGSEVQ